MDLSIIIVSWNVRKYLERCLASIVVGARGLSFEVFVVDNASTDGTVDFLQHFNALTFQRFNVILNKKNSGFAVANNQAARQAKGEYILLLNPDTEFIASREGDTGGRDLNTRSVSEHGAAREATGPRFVMKSASEPLKAMLHFMEAHPRCGILGPKLLNSDGTLQPSVRRFPDAWGPLLFSLGIRPKRYLATDVDYTKAQQVDQVMGAAFLIRRSTLDAIGLLDERFFIWFEEVDYCKQAKNAGWEVWYTPDASILHHGGESFAQVMTTKKQWMYSKSLLYYFRKHGQWVAYLLNLTAVPFRLFFSLFQ